MRVIRFDQIWNLLGFIANRSPFTHRKGPNGKPYELPPPDTDISFVSSGRPSIDNIFPLFADSFDSGPTPPRLSGFSEVENQGFESLHLGRRSVDIITPPEFSSISGESDASPSKAMVTKSKLFSYKIYIYLHVLMIAIYMWVVLKKIFVKVIKTERHSCLECQRVKRGQFYQAFHGIKLIATT